MSLFGALNTAISGLNAQSASFSNIGDNVANSQTVGFKSVETKFEDYLTSSTPTSNQSGAVVARPDYQNSVEGTVTQTGNGLNLAISGQGFFNVSQATTENNGAVSFDTTPQYSRTGDFKLNKDGYIVNGSGDYLNGWIANSAGVLDQTKSVPIQVQQTGYSPVPTSTAALAANLPASPDGTPIATQIPVVDSLGRSQTLNLAWTPTPATGTPTSWSVAISQGDGTALGSATVKFGSAGNPGAPEGTVGSITGSGGATGSTFSTGGAATLGFTANFGAGTQPISLNLGNFGQSNGLTQYAGTSYSPRSLTQDGVAPGGYNGVSTNANGEVVVNYDNGQSRVVAKVPVVTFANVDALQRQNGQAFTVTRDSGAAQTEQSGSNGAGSLVTDSVESSNVDIAGEFTKLIVAQRAYTANTKLVTTADQLLQETINMKT